MGSIDFGVGDFFKFGLPGGPESALYKQFKRGNGYVPLGPNTTPPTTADQVLLSDPLKAPLGQISQKGQGSLADALGKVSAQASTSQIASGRPRGQYIGQALGRANTMASRGIEDSVAGALGGASLKDYQNQKEFEQNMALANEIGALNSPSLIQQILGGANSAAQGAGEFKGLYDALGRKGSSGGSSYRDTGPSLNYYDPYSSGYSRYQ